MDLYLREFNDWNSNIFQYLRYKYKGQWIINISIILGIAHFLAAIQIQPFGKYFSYQVRRFQIVSQIQLLSMTEHRGKLTFCDIRRKYHQHETITNLQRTQE